MTRAVLLRAGNVVRNCRLSQKQHFYPPPAPVPCDGCPHTVTCCSRQLACNAFAEYVKTGRWKAQPPSRLPSRRPFQRLFRH